MSKSLLRRTLLVAFLAAMLLAALGAPAAMASSEAAPAASWSGGYWYTVRPGDTWFSVSAMTGVPVATLQAHNPAAMHPPHYWLFVGEVLWIPTGMPGPIPVPPGPVPVPPGPEPIPPTGGYWYTVQWGDSWSRISAWTGVSVHALQAANPSKVRPPSYWLYAGETLWIPGGSTPPQHGYWYTVVRGDSWTRISQRTGVSVAALQAANPAAVRPPNYWLYAGEVLWIP